MTSSEAAPQAPAGERTRGAAGRVPELRPTSGVSAISGPVADVSHAAITRRIARAESCPPPSWLSAMGGSDPALLIKSLTIWG